MTHDNRAHQWTSHAYGAVQGTWGKCVVDLVGWLWCVCAGVNTYFHAHLRCECICSQPRGGHLCESHHHTRVRDVPGHHTDHLAHSGHSTHSFSQGVFLNNYTQRKYGPTVFCNPLRDSVTRPDHSPTSSRTVSVQAYSPLHFDGL